MKRSLISALASLLLALDVRAAEPRWTVEFKEGSYSFETATGREVTQQAVAGKTFPGYLLLNLPPDVDPATTSRGILLGRVRVPEGRVTWLKGTEYAIGEMLPAHHRIVITPNGGFEPGLWAVTVKDSVRDKSAKAVNPTNALWTVDIGMPPGRAVKGEEGPARNPMKLMFTKEVDPTTYADGIIVEKQLSGGGWKAEPRGTAALPPKEHGGARNEVALLPMGGWERGATYRVRITGEIRDFGGMPLTNAEDFVITVPKSGPLQTRQAAKRPVAAPTQAASAAGPLFPGGQPLGWHGHWTDPITGLIYTQHRWYDPRSGTFLAPDPMEDLDSPNLFLFGGGRPHEVVDPLGLAVTVKAEVPGAPCNFVPSVDMETGRYPLLDAVLLGPISSLENAGRKGLNTLMNAGCAVGVGIDRTDQALWEGGVLCRGCLSFGIDLGLSLSGTAEFAHAKDVTSVYSKALLGRPPPLPSATAGAADGSSVWSKGPGPRGLLIEDAIESSGLRTGRLPKGFRGVDFHEGTVTSVKSIDLGSPTYQEPKRVLSTVNRYIDSLHEFTGGALRGRVIRPADITARQLDLVVPPAPPTAAQRIALEEAKSYASQKGITLNIYSVDGP